MGDYLSVDRSDSGIATITLHHGKVNALCVGLLTELAAAASSLSTDENRPRVVVVTGGPKVFAAGADINEFAANPEPDNFSIAPPGEVATVGQSFLVAMNAVAAIPVPTIAVVNGFALGGGCELALSCDFRIASNSAKFGLPEILLGIIPGGGGTQRLARLVGPSAAKELIFTGRMIDAEEASRIGLVNQVCEPDELDTVVAEFAAKFTAGPQHALALAKAAIDGGLSLSLADGLDLENRLFVESFATPDATVGVRSFLVEGPGKADFSASNI